MLHDSPARGEDLADLAAIQDKRKKALRPEPEGPCRSDVRTELLSTGLPEPLSWRGFPFPRD